MDENILDLRNRPSPEPLVEARRLIQAGETRSFVVLLTDVRCAENLALLAAGAGWSSRVERTIDGDLRVALRARRAAPGALPTLTARAGDAPRVGEASPPLDVQLSQLAPVARTVVVIASQRLGEGELGEQILKSLVSALAHAPLPPDAIVLLNDGARLIDETSGVAPALEALAHHGTTVLVGAACVERFGLAHQLRFAKPVAMTELASILLAAERVIRL